MAVNFNELPGDKPGFAIPPKGKYLALIEKAEMKVSKNNPQNPPYLSLVLSLTDENGKACGKIFDIMTESDNDFVRYKLKRFITAMQVPITGSFELKDLTKIVQGKKMYVDITTDEKADPPKGVVDIFTNEVFYPLEEDVNEPINAPDGDPNAPLPDAPEDTIY